MHVWLIHCIFSFVTVGALVTSRNNATDALAPNPFLPVAAAATPSASHKTQSEIREPLTRATGFEIDEELLSDVVYFEKIPVYGYKRVHEEKVGAAKRLEWMMVFPVSYTSMNLLTFCMKLASPARCNYVGHPEMGGVSVLNINAFEHEMRASASNAEGARYIEVDGFTKKFYDNSQFPFPKVHRQPDSEGVEKPEAMPDIPGVRSEGEGGVPGRIPWGLDRIDNGREGMDGKFSVANGGHGVHVYHLDTGIKTTLAEFTGRAIPTLDMTMGSMFGMGYKECTAQEIGCAFDLDGHGTHTAGTIVAETYGVARQANVHAVKVLGDNGSGAWSWFVGAIDWVIAKGIRPSIISASLGGKGHLQTVKEAIVQATNTGIAVVVAAGNENLDACAFSPSYVESSIAVGSTDMSDRRSPFSNYGACTDIFAPGSHIESLDLREGHTAVMSGTSMAAPHVAGATALIMEQYPGIAISQIKGRLSGDSTRGAIADVQQMGTINRLLHVGMAPNNNPPIPMAPLARPAFDIGSLNPFAGLPFGR